MKRSIISLLFVASFMMAMDISLASTRVAIKQGDDLVKVFSGKNTKYVIKENINLAGNRVVIGGGSTLIFKGGSLSNGTVVGTNTKIKARDYEIFKRGYVRYRAYIPKDYKKGYPPNMKKEYHDCIIIEGTWNNNKCGTNWTGLLNNSNEDVMLAVKNFVVLHKLGSKVKLPRISALGYETTKFPAGYTIDFNNSTISYPDNLSVWEDASIVIPQDAIPCSLESGYGLITVNSNTKIVNLSVDGKSTFRQNETIRLGVSNIICIGNSQNVTFENVSLSNVLGPAMVAHPKTKDITFKNCSFYNIGEHVLYSQQYLGYCQFIGCTFDTWDSERISVFRNGTNYLYKHTPYQEHDDATTDELYAFDLSFTDCTFINPPRVNSQGRTLGGFLTGDFPVVVRVNNCKFIGAAPKLNPGGKDEISEKSGKMYKMIIKGCEGAPYAYPSNGNYNIITEYYDCKNIPFRMVYAKRYENCEMNIDIYEDNIENVSASFEAEFSEPLVVKNCVFTDHGNDVKINHPLFHRPVVFEGCTFNSNVKRDYTAEVVTVKSEKQKEISFNSCSINLPGFRLIGGDRNNYKVRIIDCDMATIDQHKSNE